MTWPYSRHASAGTPSGHRSAAQGAGRELSAAEVLLATAPPDDAGAQTDDRYHWQAAMAAADCLSLYRDAVGSDGSLRGDCADRIVCEWHEDWVVMSQDEVELVSAKHRDPSAGAYTTIPRLVDEGGLAHLFSRWAALGEKPICRLVTQCHLA